MNYLGTKKKIALTVNGEAVTEYEFDYSKESENAIALWNDNTIVWYDKKTCELIKKIDGLSSIILSHNIFILTYDNSKYKGANALDGKTIILPNTFTDIIPNEYCIELVKDDKYGACTYKGKCILPARYEDLLFLESGIVVTNEDTIEYYGLYPYDGTGAIISNKYTFTHRKNEEVLIYKSETKDLFVIFSHDGKPLGEFKTYGGRFYLYDDAIKVESKKCYGLVSFTGKEIVPTEYDHVNGYGKVGKRFYILDKGDKAGIATIEKGITIPVEFDENISIYGDYIVVRKGGKEALYTYDGKELISLGNQRITECFFETPGVFEVINPLNKECKTMMYIAPLNKYMQGCNIKLDKAGYYCYCDTISGEWIRI